VFWVVAVLAILCGCEDPSPAVGEEQRITSRTNGASQRREDLSGNELREFNTRARSSIAGLPPRGPGHAAGSSAQPPGGVICPGEVDPRAAVPAAGFLLSSPPMSGVGGGAASGRRAIAPHC